MELESPKHFILVHGGCHGAWCWYKLSTLLTSAGHQVTALDLAACGVHPKRIEEMNTLHDHVQPLMELMASIPSHKRVILVGHSFGGIALSLAMERFPEKISVGVFATAMMPSVESSPSTIIGKILEKWDDPMDNQMKFEHGVEKPPTSILFGPKFMASKLYQCCSPEDHTLGTMLVRPGKGFYGDLSKENMLSKERYGSVSRVFLVCKEDLVIGERLQRWMIANSPPEQVMDIAGADHMVMLSKPVELCHCLLEIAKTYA
ncbi:hypothetical protein ACLOJK_003017 [Asimina triloba]